MLRKLLIPVERFEKRPYVCDGDLLLSVREDKCDFGGA